MNIGALLQMLQSTQNGETIRGLPAGAAQQNFGQNNFGPGAIREGTPNVPTYRNLPNPIGGGGAPSNQYASQNLEQGLSQIGGGNFYELNPYNPQSYIGTEGSFGTVPTMDNPPNRGIGDPNAGGRRQIASVTDPKDPTGSTGTSTIGDGGVPAYRAAGSAAGTNGSGFDWGQFLQLVGGTGSEIYNAVTSGRNAQNVANTANPFASQYPQYQAMLQQYLGKQENPYGSMFNAAYGNQQNPYTAQYQQMLANQNNPYAAPVMNAINNQSNPYAKMISEQWGKQDNPYAAQLQGLLKDPNSFKTDPGYQFALSQGQKGIERASNALYGTARTGSLAPELAKYTEGYANQAYSDRINQLAGLTNAQNTYNANSMNTLANLSGNQNAYNVNNLNALGNLSGQQQTTNTNQLQQIMQLIGGQNSYNLGNLNAVSNMFGLQGNQNNQLIQQLLMASGATAGSPAVAAQALAGGQQGFANSFGALLQAAPQLAQYVPQLLGMFGGSGTANVSVNPFTGEVTYGSGAGSSIGEGNQSGWPGEEVSVPTPESNIYEPVEVNPNDIYGTVD